MRITAVVLALVSIVLAAYTAVLRAQVQTPAPKARIQLVVAAGNGVETTLHVTGYYYNPPNNACLLVSETGSLAVMPGPCPTR